MKGFRKNSDLPAESPSLPFDGWMLPETRLSDHASFWEAGLPALRVTDTAFFRNPTIISQAIRSILLISHSG